MKISRKELMEMIKQELKEWKWDDKDPETWEYSDKNDEPEIYDDGLPFDPELGKSMRRLPNVEPRVPRPGKETLNLKHRELVLGKPLPGIGLKKPGVREPIPEPVSEPEEKEEVGSVDALSSDLQDPEEMGTRNLKAKKFTKENLEEVVKEVMGIPVSNTTRRVPDQEALDAMRDLIHDAIIEIKGKVRLIDHNLSISEEEDADVNIIQDAYNEIQKIIKILLTCKQQFEKIAKGA